MSNYVKTTNFAAKDALASGNPSKTAKGTEVDTEFNNIATAIATKEDLANKGVANGYVGIDASGNVSVTGNFSATGSGTFATGVFSTSVTTPLVNGSSTLGLQTGGSTRLSINSTGNITANAPSSGTTLDLTAPAGGQSILARGVAGNVAAIFTAAAGVQAGIQIGQTGQTAWQIYQPASSNDLRLFAGADRITISSSGNVTIAPSAGTAVTISSGGASITGTVTATAFSGPLSGSVTGNVTGDVTGNVSGNAGTATALQTARTINGVSFNGTANITVTASADTLTGTTLPALSGVNLTALNASNLGSGTVPSARVSGSYTSITAIGNATANDSSGNALDIGWRDMPQISSTSITLDLSHRGKHIYAAGTTSTVNIPANGSVAFPVGTTIVLVNEGTGNMTVNITTDVLQWLQGGAATGGAGTPRTVATNSVVTLLKVSSTRWVITGNGIS